MRSPTSIASYALKELLEKAGIVQKYELTKVESFGFFLEEYVTQGASLTTEGRNVTLTAAVISFDDALWSVEAWSSKVSLPNATYFLDFTPINGFSFDLAHPTDRYLPLWEVTTDASGNISGTTDKRGPMDMVRFKNGVQGIEEVTEAINTALAAAQAADVATGNTIAAIVAAVTATNNANTAASTANTAATGANTAATNANNAAASITDIRQEVENARTGKDGTAHAKLKNRLDTMETRQLEAVKQSKTLNHGSNIISADQAGPLDVTVYGQSRMNILGADGGCESLTPFSTLGTSPVVSTTQKRNGLNSIKIIAGTNCVAYKDYTYPLDTTKSYILAAWVYIESYTAGTLTIRLYDSGGFTSQRYSVNADTTKIGQWQLIYIKIPTGNTIATAGFRLYFGGTSNPDCVAYFDDIRMFEVSTTLYNAIGTTITPTSAPSIDEVLPYVDGIKHTQGIAIQKTGKNQIPPFTDAAWNVHANAKAIGPYDLELNATANSQPSFVTLRVIPNTNYTINMTTNGLYAITDGANAVNLLLYGTGQRTFNTGAYSSIRVYLSNNNLGAGKYSFTNPQLELGTVATPFEPRNDDYIFADVTLASSIDNTVRDVLYREGADWLVLRKLKADVVLDGLLTWTFAESYIGYKRIFYTKPADFAASNIYMIAKYNNVPLMTNISGGVYTGGDQSTVGSGINISISNADSGWTDTINPNANAIKSCMNGWKANGNNGTVYNSWVSILDGSAPATNTEAYCAANKAPNWTGWGTLSYQLAAPVTENVTAKVEGSISLHQGQNIVEVFEGVIVREKVTPAYSAAFKRYYVNSIGGIDADVPESRMKNRIGKLIDILKNSSKDTSKWVTTGGANVAYGNQRFYLEEKYFDSTAEYRVTYVMLDKYAYTANVTEVAVRYSTTDKAVLTEVVKQLADDETAISIHGRTLVDILARLKAGGL